MKLKLGLPIASTFWRTCAYGTVIGAVVAGTVILLWQLGADWASMLRDGGRVKGQSPFAGLFSNIGIAIMAISASMCFYAALRKLDARLTLVLICAFAAGFAMDDGFMLHEELRSLEWLVFLFHGVVFLGLFWTATRQKGHLFVWPILLIGGLFAGSIVVDLFWAEIRGLVSGLGLQLTEYSHTFFEDVPKFVGIILFGIMAAS